MRRNDVATMSSADVAATRPQTDEDEAGAVDRSGSCSDPLSRWVLVGVAVFFLVVAFSQAWGKIETDANSTGALPNKSSAPPCTRGTR